MKTRLLAAVLLLTSLFLAGCSARQQEAAVQPKKPLAELVSGVVPDAGELVPLTADDLSDVLGIEPEDYSEFVYLQDDGLGGREILVLRCAAADKVAKVTEHVKKYLEQRRKETRNYLPEAYQLLTAAEVEAKGLTVALFSGANAAEERRAVLAGE